MLMSELLQCPKATHLTFTRSAGQPTMPPMAPAQGEAGGGEHYELK